MPATGARKDPLAIGFFKIELEGLEAGSFRKCQGMKTETEVFEYQEGGDNETVRKLLGPTKASNIVLTKGYVADDVLFNWRKKYAESGTDKITRCDGSIVAIAADGKTELKRWNFKKGWAVRWEMNEFDSATGAASCEILEIAVESIQKG